MNCVYLGKLKALGISFGIIFIGFIVLALAASTGQDMSKSDIITIPPIQTSDTNEEKCITAYYQMIEFLNKVSELKEELELYRDLPIHEKTQEKFESAISENESKLEEIIKKSEEYDCIKYQKVILEDNPELFAKTVQAIKKTNSYLSTAEIVDTLLQTEEQLRQQKLMNEERKNPIGDGPQVLESEHSHAALLIKIFGDKFDFSSPAYQVGAPQTYIEERDGSTIHKHVTGITLGYIFETLNMGLDDRCYRFTDGREFCSNKDYKLKFFINREQVPDIREYEIRDDDRILIVYGNETPKEIDVYLMKLENQEIIRE